MRQNGDSAMTIKSFSGVLSDQLIELSRIVDEEGNDKVDNRKRARDTEELELEWLEDEDSHNSEDEDNMQAYCTFDDGKGKQIVKCTKI